MLRTSVVALALSAGVILSGSAFAESPSSTGLGACRWWPMAACVAAGPVRPSWSRTAACGPGARGERVRSGGGERVRQPGSAEKRGPRHRVRQAVGFVRLRVVDGVVDGVLGPLDCASRVTAQAN